MRSETAKRILSETDAETIKRVKEVSDKLVPKEYVLGFAFDETKNNVVLILKNRPAWQKGFYNGVGGKVEKYDEDYHAAMSREFLEETGVLINPNEWDYFAAMEFKEDILGGSAIVYCFRIFTDLVREVDSQRKNR